MYLNNNLKLLRAIKGRSCDEVANVLGVKRSTMSGWENGMSEPNCSTLLKLGSYYQLSLDILVGKDLATMRRSEVEELQRGY